MKDISLIEKIKILMDLISSSPLFLFFSMLIVAATIFLIICIKKDIKINKWLFIVFFGIVLFAFIINYSNVLLTIVDNLFEEVFMALYFPNFTVYLLILIISNFFLIYSIFSKQMQKSRMVLNIINAFIIDVFLIIVIDIVNRNNINIYETLTVFSNSDLLVILELNSAVFASWILISLLIKARIKLKKYDKKEEAIIEEIIVEEKPEIVFDDIDMKKS